MTHTQTPTLDSTNTVNAQRDGCRASATDLAPLAFAGYAHFTAMQVRAGCVRGLDLHLQRLRDASEAMFGRSLSDAVVKQQLRTALAQAPGGLSLTATVYSSAGEFTAAQHDGALHLLVRTSAPSDGPQTPLRMQLVEFERALPEIKHVGEIAKTWFLRQAVAKGFDDAAFIDRQGHLSEATIWNLAFWDGQSVVWPRAAMLRGTTMLILMRQLERLGVPQRLADVGLAALPAMQGAVVMNSWTPAVPVLRLGHVDIPAAPNFVALLQRAFANEPLMAI